MSPLQRLRAAGVSIWLDTPSRELLDSGRFERHVREHGVTGVTANPTILERALSDSSAYDEQLRRLASRGKSAKAAFFELALEDVRRAAELLRPAHDGSAGHDGFVSLEVTPDLADDPAGTVDQAVAVWRRLDLPNLVIKVPATEPGLTAIDRRRRSSPPPTTAPWAPRSTPRPSRPSRYSRRRPRPGSTSSA